MKILRPLKTSKLYQMTDAEVEEHLMRIDEVLKKMRKISHKCPICKKYRFVWAEGERIYIWCPNCHTERKEKEN